MSYVSHKKSIKWKNSKGQASCYNFAIRILEYYCTIGRTLPVRETVK